MGLEGSDCDEELTVGVLPGSKKLLGHLWFHLYEFEACHNRTNGKAILDSMSPPRTGTALLIGMGRAGAAGAGRGIVLAREATGWSACTTTIARTEYSNHARDRVGGWGDQVIEGKWEIHEGQVIRESV